MCPAFRQREVLARSQQIKMPPGESVVSVGPNPGDHLLPWTKQHLPFEVGVEVGDTLQSGIGLSECLSRARTGSPRVSAAQSRAQTSKPV